MPQRKPKKLRPGSLIGKIRKPMAPPSKTIEDPTKYKRERELEKLRREEKSGNS
jgi:hypothetical protein